MIKIAKKVIIFALIFVIILAWSFDYPPVPFLKNLGGQGWPQIWRSPPFPPTVEQAQATTRTIEQQINIIDQQYSSFVIGSYGPTNNSFGLIRWDTAKYNGDTVYFEVIIKNGDLGTASAALFSANGTQVTGSEVSGVSGAYVRVRSAPLTLGTLPNLESGVDYTVRVKNSTAPFEVPPGIEAARLIIVQTDATSIIDTETQIEVGDNATTTGTSYADLNDKKIYRYTSANWTPEPTTSTYFEATIRASTASTPAGPNTPAANSNCVQSDNPSGTVGWTNPGNAFSDNATYATASVDGTVTEYIKCTNFGFTLPTNATVVGIVGGVERKSSSTGNGGSKDSGVRIVKGGIIGTTDKSTATTYTISDVFEDHGGSADLWGETWLYSDINAATFGLAFAATKASSAGAAHTVSVDTIRITVYYTVPGDAAYAALYDTVGNYVAGSEVSTTSTSWVRIRTGSSITLSDATDYVVRIKTSAAAATAYIANAKIILDQTNASGISAMEIVHQYVNTDSPISLSGGTTYARLAVAGGAPVANSTISTTTASYTRVRSATSISLTNNNYDTEISENDTSYTQTDFDNQYTSTNWVGGTFTYYFEATIRGPSPNAEISTSWLIIQVSGLAPAAGTLTTDIVDASYVPVGSPTMAMSAATFSFTCQTKTGSFGTASQQIYVNNNNGANNGWTLTVAAQATTNVWDSVGTDYDFNDLTGSGCTDGADAGDSVGGQMTVNPSVATLAIGQCGSCTTNNISKGSSAAFNQGTTDTITLLTATAASDDVGDWTLQGVSISQKIPAEQPAASDYDINMVLTVTAN